MSVAPKPRASFCRVFVPAHRDDPVGAELRCGEHAEQADGAVPEQDEVPWSGLDSKANRKKTSDARHWFRGLELRIRERRLVVDRLAADLVVSVEERLVEQVPGVAATQPVVNTKRSLDHAG